MALNRINFVGTAVIPKQKDKFGFIMQGKTAAGKQYKRMNLGVKESEHNMAFTELFGCEQDVIKTKDTDGNDIEIKWEDRFDEGIINEVANYRKIVVDFSELTVNDEPVERKEFISNYDAIEYVGKMSEHIKDKKICVTGNFQLSPYKGKFNSKYQIQNIYLAKEDAKPGLIMNLELFYDKDGFDDSDWSKEKITALSAYAPMYISKDEGNKYVPIRLVFNCTKANFEDEKISKRVEYIKGLMKSTKKNYVHLPFKCKVLNGSEEVEITYDMLTKKQKESVDLGINTVEDYKKKTFGDRVQEYRIIAPILTDDFDDGFVEIDDSASEFEDMIYKFSEKESLDEVVAKAEKKVEEKKEEPEIDDEDIFG